MSPIFFYWSLISIARSITSHIHLLISQAYKILNGTPPFLMTWTGHVDLVAGKETVMVRYSNNRGGWNNRGGGGCLEK